MVNLKLLLVIQYIHKLDACHRGLYIIFNVTLVCYEFNEYGKLECTCTIYGSWSCTSAKVYSENINLSQNSTNIIKLVRWRIVNDNSAEIQNYLKIYIQGVSIKVGHPVYFDFSNNQYVRKRKYRFEGLSFLRWNEKNNKTCTLGVDLRAPGSF